MKYKVGDTIRLEVENDLVGLGYITARVTHVKMLFGEQWVFFDRGHKWRKVAELPIHPTNIPPNAQNAP